eukprot:s1199_g11.t1
MAHTAAPQSLKPKGTTLPCLTPSIELQAIYKSVSRNTTASPAGAPRPDLCGVPGLGPNGGKAEHSEPRFAATRSFMG